MTDLVMTYTVNPISGFFKRLGKGMIRMFETAGKARAARVLADMGYYEEAKRLMLDLK